MTILYNELIFAILRVGMELGGEPYALKGARTVWKGAHCSLLTKDRKERKTGGLPCLSNIFAGTELSSQARCIKFLVSYYYEIGILLCIYRGVVETLSVSM